MKTKLQFVEDYCREEEGICRTEKVDELTHFIVTVEFLILARAALGYRECDAYAFASLTGFSLEHLLAVHRFAGKINLWNRSCYLRLTRLCNKSPMVEVEIYTCLGEVMKEFWTHYRDLP